MLTQSTDVDNLLYQLNNRKKNKTRLCYMWFYFIITFMFIGLEAVINAPCIVQEKKTALFINDVYLYISTFIIAGIEILFEFKKIQKTQKKIERARDCSKCVLIIYIIYIAITIVSLCIHTGVQMYYPINEFDQTCFYLKDKLEDEVEIWKIIKILIIDVFIFDELCTLYIFQNALCKNMKVLNNPRKYIQKSMFRTESHDIIVNFASQ